MCPPAGTSALSIATAAYIPDATNTVDSALSSALHHQNTQLFRLQPNAINKVYISTIEHHLIFFSNASVVGFPYLPYSKLACLPS